MLKIVPKPSIIQVSEWTIFELQKNLKCRFIRLTLKNAKFISAFAVLNAFNIVYTDLQKDKKFTSSYSDIFD